MFKFIRFSDRDYLDIAEQLENTDYHTAILYTDSAIAIAEHEDSEEQHIEALELKMSILYRHREFENALHVADRLRNMYKKAGRKTDLAENYELSGRIYYKQDKYITAMEYYLTADSLAAENNSTLIQASIQNRIGDIYQEQENLNEALKSHYAALNLCARDTSVKAESIRATAHNRLGIIYKAESMYDSAVVHHTKVLKYGMKYKKESYLAHTYNNLGIIHMHQKQYQKALENYENALHIHQKNGNIKAEAGILINMGKLFLLQKKYQQAHKFLLNGKSLAQTAKAFEFLRNAYSLLTDLHSEMKDYKQAFTFHLKYTELNDSLMRQSNNDALAELQVKYKTRQKEQQNKILSQNLEITRLKLEKRKKAEYLYIVSIAAMLILLLVIFITLRARKKAYCLLAEKNIKINEQNIEILTQNNKIERKNKKLKLLNDTKQTILSIIAHDLKNPFHSIIGLSDILHEQLESMTLKESKEMINLINNSSQDAHTLLDNLLDWSRLQTGDMHTKPEHFKLKKLVDDTISILAVQLTKKQQRVETGIPEELMTFADKTMIATVIRNLVSNASKFTARKGLIKIKAQNDINHITVQISDNGLGIAQEDIPGLFEITGKKSTFGTENEKGSGLGLQLCKEFININNGEISVESTLGKGTTFKFSLPQKP